MSLIATVPTEKDFQPAPAGTHIARCIHVIDLGHQYLPLFDKVLHKVRFAWELPNEKHVFDEARGLEPYLVGKFFSMTLGEQGALRPFLESWRGREFTDTELDHFELKKLLAAPCQLTIIHKKKEKKTFAEITGISPLMKGITCPNPVLPTLYFEVEQGEDETFKKLPEWLQKMIRGCKEWEKKASPPAETHEETQEPDDPGMPF